tara:strand:+ start:237 stop:482 length:246 start_codon:yes stop_codon:yes gene_type:complete
MLSKGNVVCLNERGVRHYHKKYYRKRIRVSNYMIVVSYYLKKNKKRYILRDFGSDLTDKYYDMHLQYCFNNTTDAVLFLDK